MQRLRLRGVLAGELGTEEGERCRVFVRRNVRNGAPLRVLTYSVDRYGRYVADVFVWDLFLNQLIIDKGLG